ncbi:MAG: PsbP-related protein [Methanomicrobiales archaeon]
MKVSRNFIILIIALIVIGVLGLGSIVYYSVNILTNSVNFIEEGDGVYSINLIGDENGAYPESTYSGNGISFNYTKSWVLSSIETEEGIPGTKIICGSKIDSSNNSANYIAPSFQVTIIPYLGLYTKITGQKITVSVSEDQNYKIISKKTIQIIGVNAEELTSVYTEPDSGEMRKMQEISFVKNMNIYTISFDASESDFDKEKTSFDMIINTLKVE